METGARAHWKHQPLSRIADDTELAFEGLARRQGSQGGVDRIEGWPTNSVHVETANIDVGSFEGLNAPGALGLHSPGRSTWRQAATQKDVAGVREDFERSPTDCYLILLSRIAGPLCGAEDLGADADPLVEPSRERFTIAWREEDVHAMPA